MRCCATTTDGAGADSPASSADDDVFQSLCPNCQAPAAGGPGWTAGSAEVDGGDEEPGEPLIDELPAEDWGALLRAGRSAGWR